METSLLKLLTIVADDALTHVLEEMLTSYGAKGFTVTRAEGKGKSGMRDNPWEGENIKIEAIVDEDVLDKILMHLKTHFFERYALIAYYSDVHVVRMSHFR